MPDLGKRLKGTAEGPTKEIDPQKVWGLGRRRLWIQRVVVGSTVLTVGLGGYVALGALPTERPNEKIVVEETPKTTQGEPAEGAERAAVFAIRALGQAGLRQQNGTYVDYRATQERGDGWIAEFGPPSDCSHGMQQYRDGEYDETIVDGWHCVDLSDETVSLEVAESDGMFIVRDVRGPLDSAQVTQISSYTEPAELEVPRFEVDDLEITHGTDESVIHASILWTGKAETFFFSDCSLVLVDESGKEVASEGYFPLMELGMSGPSDRAWEKRNDGAVSPDSTRDAHIHLFSHLDPDIEANTAEIRCEVLDLDAERTQQDAEEARSKEAIDRSCAQEGVSCIHLNGHGGDVVVVFGAAWIANTIGEGSWAVGRIDISTNELMDEIPTGEPVVDLVLAGGFVWAIGDASVVRIDPTTNQVSGPPVPIRGSFVGDPLYGGSVGDVDAAASPGAVWVTGSKATLQRIDTTSLEVETFSLAPPLKEGGDWGPPHIAAGEDAIWLQQGDKLYRFDPETRSIESFEFGTNTRSMTFGLGGVWVARNSPYGSNEVDFFSPLTEEDQMASVAEVPEEITTGSGYAWALGGGLLFAIDPKTMTVIRTVEVARSGWGGVGFGEGSAWVAGDDIVYRVERR